MSRIDDSIEEMQSCLEDLKLTHREYIKRILENASMEKEEMNQTLHGCNGYLKEVVGQVWEVIALHFKFKYKQRVLKLKVELIRRFENYNKFGTTKLSIHKMNSQGEGQKVKEKGLQYASEQGEIRYSVLI